MGCCSFVGKSAAVLAALFAVFVSLLFSGALRATGLFRYMDGFEGSRGQFFKGMMPALHEGTPWEFTLEDMPELGGKTVFVTGANVGLGYWTAYHLAASHATVILGCRSEPKCAAAAAKIREGTGVAVETATLDLASFASIRACAASVAAAHPTLDSLVLNAGVMIPPFGLTAEGLEMQIGVNHFGHFLLTQLLLPQVEAAATATGVATVVAVSSAAHFDSYPEGILPSIGRMNDEAGYRRDKAYGQSKLANVLFAQELAARVTDKNILVNSVHPGYVDTELGRHFDDMLRAVHPALADWFMATAAAITWRPREAALTQLFAAVGPRLLEERLTGRYFHPIARETQPDPHARDAALQARLWKMSEDFVAANAPK